MKSLETEGSHNSPSVCVTDGIMCEVNCLNFSPYAVIKLNQSAVSYSLVFFLLQRAFYQSVSFFLRLLHMRNDGGLPCEVSEGQWSRNCVRTTSVGNISLMGKMQEEMKITQREHLHFNEFLLILCMGRVLIQCRWDV